MNKHFTATLTETYNHLTIEELNEQLKLLSDDYLYDWEISKDYCRDYDGFLEFNGHYNLSIKCSIRISEFGENTVNDLKNNIEECYKILKEVEEDSE